jgi:hypothetical protein
VKACRGHKIELTYKLKGAGCRLMMLCSNLGHYIKGLKKTPQGLLLPILHGAEVATNIAGPGARITLGVALSLGIAAAGGIIPIQTKCR